MGEIELTVMMMVITGSVPDVQCLVFSPVSIEVPESRYQSREAVSPLSPVGEPVLSTVAGGLVVHLGEGGEHEAGDDRGEGSDGQRRQAHRGHGESRHGNSDYHVGQHVSLGLHGHVVDHVDGPGYHVSVVRLCTVPSLSLRCGSWSCGSGGCCPGGCAGSDGRPV